MTVDIFIPVRTSSLNAKLRQHWRANRSSSKHERHVTALLLTQATQPPGPWLVTLTRLGVRPLDGDNLSGALKAIRDEVAKWLGVDDADARVTFAYAQTKASRLSVGVRIQIEVRP